MKLPPEYPEAWTKKAMDDLSFADAIRAAKDVAPWGAGAHAQQASEKLLKAFLLAKGKRPARIHHIDKLLAECVAIDPEFSEFIADAGKLNFFYIEQRYPADYPDSTWEEAEEAVAIANRIKEFVLSKIG